MKASEFVKTLASQVGYKETGNNHNKYATYFDTKPPKGAWQFFNGHKQNSDWCALLPHWGLCQHEDPEKVRVNLGEPKDGSKNCAAGVLYFYRYMQAKGLIQKKSKGKPGDIIFLNTKKKPGHVGTIEKVTTLRYHTIEGNASNMVKRKSYLKISSKIFAIGRYPFDKE